MNTDQKNNDYHEGYEFFAVFVSFVVKISSFCRGLLCYNFWDDILICAYLRSSLSLLIINSKRTINA
jgi:hypothetical protein